MPSKNDADESDEDIERALEDYEKELSKVFWFPHFCKYIAWCLAAILIIAVFVILCVYGLMFGTTKSFIWLSTVFFALVVSIFIVQPLKIIFLAIFSSFALKFQETIVMKEFDTCIMKNPPDETIKKFVTNYRSENSFLYEVTSEEALKQSGVQQRIRHHLELRLLFTDIILYLVYMFTIYFMVFQSVSNMEFHSTEAAKDLLIRGIYTRSRPLYDVSNYDELMEYLNLTLVPSLVMLYREFPEIANQKIPLPPTYPTSSTPNATITTQKIFKKRENPYLEPDTATTTQSDEITGPGEVITDRNRSGVRILPMKDRAWTLNKSIKLMGTIRARQHRVHNHTCKYHPGVKVRHFLCALDASAFNLESQNFAIDWRPWRSFEPQKGWDDMQPWTYHTWLETGSVYKMGRLTNYPGGGYILTIGKTIINAKLALDYIHYFRWIDHFTRVVFIEFTLYNVNTNLFNVVTLIFEKAAHDVIIPSYHIHTTKFIYLNNEIWACGFVIFCLFVILTLLGCIREFFRIKEGSLTLYFTEGWSLLDFSIAVLALVVVVSYISREYYVGNLLRTLERSSHNAFVSFQLAAYWNEITIYLFAFLIALSTIKVIRLMKYKVLFYQLEQVLRIAMGQVLYMILVMAVLLITFSMFFYPIMHPFHENFVNFPGTLSSLLARAAGLCVAIPLTQLNMNFAAPPVFVVFGIMFTIIITSYFWAIFNSSVNALQNQAVWNRYSLYNYARHKLFRKKLKVPETRIHYDTIEPKALPRCNPPVSVTEVRMQGMRNIVLETLTGKNHNEEIMHNVAALALSNNDQRIATDDFYKVVWENGRKELVSNARVEEMYDIALEEQTRRTGNIISHK